MSEVYLPSLPKFKIKDVEQDFELKHTTFLLNYGVLNVLCCIEAEVVIEQFDVTPSNRNVENSIECDFKYLVVGDAAVSVDQSDIDLVQGQKLELTEDQKSELNDQLKNMMERSYESS